MRVNAVMASGTNIKDFYRLKDAQPSIKKPEIHIEPNNIHAKNLENRQQSRKKVEPVNPGHIEEYLRYEDGIVNAINNIKKYIEIINVESIAESETEAEKEIKNFIEKNGKMNDSRDYQIQNRYKYDDMDNLKREVLKELKNSFSPLFTLYASYDKIIDRFREKQDAADQSKKAFDKKSEIETHRQYSDNRRSKARADISVLSIMQKQSDTTDEMAYDGVRRTTGNFDFSQKKFNEKFFTELLVEKKKEIKKNLEVAEKIKNHIEVNDFQKVAKELKSFIINKDQNLAIKELIEVQILDNYTSKGQSKSLHINNPIFSITG